MTDEEIIKYIISLFDYFGYDYNISLLVPSVFLIKYGVSYVYNYYKEKKMTSEVNLTATSNIDDLWKTLNENTKELDDLKTIVNLMNDKMNILNDKINEYNKDFSQTKGNVEVLLKLIDK